MLMDGQVSVGVISNAREVFVWPVVRTVVSFECLFLFLLFKCPTVQLSADDQSQRRAVSLSVLTPPSVCNNSETVVYRRTTKLEDQRRQ